MHFLVVTGEFIQQPSTDTDRVCLGTSAEFNCTIRAFFEGASINASGIDALWIRNETKITNTTSNHILLRTRDPLRSEDDLVVTGLKIIKTSQADDGAEYICTARGANSNFSTIVVLNVTGGMF